MENKYYMFNNGTNLIVDINLIKCAYKSFFDIFNDSSRRMYEIAIVFKDDTDKSVFFNTAEERDLEYDRFSEALISV